MRNLRSRWSTFSSISLLLNYSPEHIHGQGIVKSSRCPLSHVFALNTFGQLQQQVFSCVHQYDCDIYISMLFLLNIHFVVDMSLTSFSLHSEFFPLVGTKKNKKVPEHKFKSKEQKTKGINSAGRCFYFSRFFRYSLKLSIGLHSSLQSES